LKTGSTRVVEFRARGIVSTSPQTQVRRFTAEAVIDKLRLEVRQTVAASPGATTRARLRSSARLLRLPIGRLADWFYGEVRRVEAQEADQIRHYVRAARRRAEELERRLERQYEAVRAELVDNASPVVGSLAPPSARKAAPREAAKGKRAAPR
jgi:hypothetical protein